MIAILVIEILVAYGVFLVQPYPFKKMIVSYIYYGVCELENIDSFSKEFFGM